jgi:hypothetical protein
MPRKLEAAKCGDRTEAVDVIVEATGCGVDDATIVVFMFRCRRRQRSEPSRKGHNVVLREI